MAGAVLPYRQLGVIAALPVQPQPDSVTLDVRDDLDEQRPHNAFAALRGRPLMVPGPFEVGAQRKILFPFVRSERLPFLAGEQRRHVLLTFPHDCQTLIPASFQLAGDQSVVRIHGIVLSTRTFLLEPGCFDVSERETRAFLRSPTASSASSAWRNTSHDARCRSSIAFNAASIPNGFSTCSTTSPTARSTRSPPNEMHSSFP